MSQNNNNKTFELKDIELILWALPGIVFTLSLFLSYNLNYLISQPAVLLDIFLAFSPFSLALLFSFIYNEFPISHISGLLKKDKVEK